MTDIDAGGAAFKLKLQDDLTRNVKEAMRGVAQAVTQASRQIDAEIRELGRNVQAIGAKITAVGIGLAGIGGTAAAVFGRSIVAAGNFAETLAMFEAVFKDQSVAVRSWGQMFAKEVGRSEAMVLRFLAEAQDTFVPLGFDRKEAAELSKTVAKLAVDLGTFRSEIGDEGALRRLLGGIIGNTENLRAFGVVAQDAQIKAQALSMGFDPRNLTAYQRAMAILEITIAGTADAQGAAAKRSGSFVNTIRKLKAAFSDLAVAIGEPLREAVSGLISAFADLVQGFADFLKANPIATKVAAALTAVMTGLGLALSAVGVAVVAVGTKIAALGIGLIAFKATGLSLTGVIVKLTSAINALAASLTGLTVASALRGALGGIAGLVSGIVGLVGRALAWIARLATGPVGLIALAVATAMKGIEYFYRRREALERKYGGELEQERQRILAQSYRDAGQPVPADLSKTFDPNNAAVVPPELPPNLKALTEAQRDLADEIRAMRTPLEMFRERIKAATKLLDRGEITQAQFDAFSDQESERFRNSDPVTQQRDALIEQLKTPAERLKEAIANARRLFANDADNFRRAVAAATKTFELTDPAEQLKQRLMTPIERYREAVAEAKRLLVNQPKLLQRAISLADAELAAARKKPKKKSADQESAENIRDAIKSDARRAAERMADAMRLVTRGILSKEEARKFGKKLTEDFLGDSPAVKEFKNLATTSAAVASQVGSFAPSFDNTASEERAFRNKQLKLQQLTAKELKKIRKKKPVFL